jgi:ABC-type molybdenum transport system ATPase subunit/photorepair protein PhrA
MKTPLRSKRGRPTKYTAEMVKAICQAVADGLPFKLAAAVGGISHETFCQWQHRFPEFSEAIQTAVASGVQARLKIIRTAAEKGDVKAAQWWLEHVLPEHFARNRVEVKHEGSVEHQFAIPSGLLNEIARARAEHERIAST